MLPAMATLLVLSLLLLLPAEAHIGVNYGRVGDNLPPADVAVILMKSIGADIVKIFDTNPEVLKALAHSGIKVSVMVRNEDLPEISTSRKLSDEWIVNNILPYYPATEINLILVGNEILAATKSSKVWMMLLPAMKNIRASLLEHNLTKIKVSTAIEPDVMSSTYPPSRAVFRKDIASSIMPQLLKFLSETESPFFVNLYPYFAWARNPESIMLDYANFRSSHSRIQDGRFWYTNLLDAMLDAVFVAIQKLGFQSIQIVLSETGWPTEGEVGCTVKNAQIYNQGLVNKMVFHPGTPRRPNASIPTYIFALFNENLKKSLREQSWGLFYPDGYPVYNIHLKTPAIVQVD